LGVLQSRPLEGISKFGFSFEIKAGLSIPQSGTSHLIDFSAVGDRRHTPVCRGFEPTAQRRDSSAFGGLVRLGRVGRKDFFEMPSTLVCG
jgi:hypothetical protein